MRLPPISALASFVAVAALGVASCSVGSGSEGQVAGTLNLPDCWIGSYALYPDFFAATPYLKTLELRIQKGGDYETFSDGVEILIDDTSTIIPSEYGKALSVSLPAGVSPVGVPLAANPNPSIVHLSVYLQATCQIQDVALYALDAVSLGPGGACEFGDAGPPPCPGSSSGLFDADAGAGSGDGGAASEAGGSVDGSSTVATDGGDGGEADGGPTGAGDASAPSIGRSQITFTSLFDGDENAVSAAERLNSGSFDVYLADPRETCPGGIGPPPPCRGHLTGSFRFYFQRGRPAQPFP